jgi:hypothetical protein
VRICRRTFAAALLAVVVECVACVHPDGGGRPAVWQLRGAVVSADPGELRVRHKSGQIVAIELDAETVVVRGDRPVPMSAVGAGTRVMIDVEPLGDGRQRARRVRVFGG